MASDGDSEVCWICLEEAAENGSHQLVAPCKCPRKVHPQCLARWQLQQAGRHEEKFCRFCNNELADWKCHLTPEELKPEVSKVQPIMVVYFEGQIHRIPVKQGPDGLDEFTDKIRELFRLPEDVDISLTFGCKEPMSGSHLKLEGMGAFDAAVHCASVAAAERQQKVKKSYSTGNLDASLAASAAQQQVTRSASSNNMPAHQISASAGAAAGGAGLSPPAPPPSAAGASAARSAAQDRRQRFAGQQQQQPAGQGQQHHQQQSQQPAGMRSRSFSAFSSSAVPRAGAREPPAAFRSILGLLNSGSSGSSGSGGGSQQPAAAGQQGRASASTIPQASPRGGAGSPLPPLSPGSATASASAAPRDARLLSAAKRERLSLRQINSLTDVPEADETLAVGSLSGRFRFTLKAFSRKVARSLSFSNKSFADDELAGARAGGGGSSSSMARAGSAGGLAGPFMDDLPAGSVSSSRGPSVTAYSSHPSAEAPLAAHPSPRGMMAASPLPPPTPAGIHSC